MRNIRYYNNTGKSTFWFYTITGLGYGIMGYGNAGHANRWRRTNSYGKKANIFVSWWGIYTALTGSYVQTVF